MPVSPIGRKKNRGKGNPGRDAESSRILVVDDDKDSVRFLQKVLRDEGYQVEVASRGDEGLGKVLASHPDLILLDTELPGIGGLEICRRLKENIRTHSVGVLLITPLGDDEAKMKGVLAGADDFLCEPYEKVELLARVRAVLKAKHLNDELDSAESIIYALAMAVEAKDAFTEGHTDRVQSYALALARKLGLPEQDIAALSKGSILHDIGKISISDEVLNKRGKLTSEEFGWMRQHPICGERICEPLKAIRDALPIIRWHHERLDGTGYPDGLRGAEVPVTAQIMGIVDVYDAVSTTRPYRSALARQTCFELLRQDAKKGWCDPQFVEAFIEAIEAPTNAQG